VKLKKGGNKMANKILKKDAEHLAVAGKDEARV